MIEAEQRVEAIGELVTLKEAAKERGVKVATLRQWVYRNKAPFIRVGRVILINRSMLSSYNQRNR